MFDFNGTKKLFVSYEIRCGVIGNSSSGIIEAPSLKKGTVNVGKDKGRVQAKSIINVNFDRKNLESN